MMKKFKDQEDYEIVLTDDNIINVLGTKGSGKTTSSLKYLGKFDTYNTFPVFSAEFSRDVFLWYFIRGEREYL